MQNKILVALIGLCVMFSGARAADDVIIDEVVVDDIEQVSADAIADYQVEGSLFQQITDLEQEKVLMQLEKERAQLDLELDRLAAEKIKLHMEIDTLSGRAEQQQQQIETEKAKLEAEAARLEREKKNYWRQKRNRYLILNLIHRKKRKNQKLIYRKNINWLMLLVRVLNYRQQSQMLQVGKQSALVLEKTWMGIR